MKLARLVLMMFLVAGWAAAQAGAQATAAPDKANDKGKQDSAAAGHKHGEGMSCCCCKDMAKKAADKDAAKSEAKSEGGMMAEGGMGCCAKMGSGGMKCGGSDAKSDTPEQKMK